MTSTDILGVASYTKSDGFQKLLATYATDIDIYDGVSAFVGQNRNLTPGNKMSSTVIQDYFLAVNGVDHNQIYDGSTWFNGGMRTHMPIALYTITVGSRAYLANLFYAGKAFKSRVWFPDLPVNNDIRWGFETGKNLVTTAGSTVVTSANSGFTLYGIKIGDHLFVSSGQNAGEYIVASIDSDFQLSLTKPMTYSSTGDTYWVGSNWFDVRVNDGDLITGLGENDNKLLVFKRDSLHRWNEQSLTRIRGALGTTSHRSIVNIRETTFYFHDTGIYRFDSYLSTLVSRPINDWIAGIDPANYPEIVGWKDGDNLYWFVGNIVNADKGINITNGLLIFDTASQAWNIGQTNDVITCAVEAVENNVRKVYLGTNNSRVIQWNSGNADLDSPISWKVATVYHFPAKAYSVVEFESAEIHSEQGMGVKVYYKLYGGDKIDSQWSSLGTVKENVTQIPFPRGKFGRGVAYMVMENSTNKSPIITRIDTYYRDREQRNLPNTADY